ncbi:MAG: hypothetical protein ACTSUF_06330 [Candidatus Heimdallarchaeaceae archaeon]
MARRDNDDIIANLKGTALRVFVYAVKQSNNIKVRETARRLGFKSPGHAQYHLNKLYTMGLLEKNDDNTYCLAEQYSNLRTLKISVLSEIYIIRGFIIPSLGLLSGFLGINLLLSLLFFFVLSPVAAYVNLSVSVILAVIFLTIRAVQIILSFKEE